MKPPQQPLSDEFVEFATSKLEGKHLGKMIRGLPPARPTTLPRPATNSSMGDLNKIPAEVFVMICEVLDFQSLSRLSRTSLQAAKVVTSLPQYWDMMKHAPTVLTALQKIHQLKFHCSANIHQTLRSKQCSSCQHFGGFIFLPTCERFCFECLDTDISLRLLRPRVAQDKFHIRHKYLKLLPSVLTLTGSYYTRTGGSRNRRHRLVCMRHVRQLADKVSGYVWDIPQEFRDPWEKLHHKTQSMFILMENPDLESEMLYYRLGYDRDEFGGAVSMRFPYLSPDGVDHGKLCQGCDVDFVNRFSVELESRYLASSLRQKVHGELKEFAAGRAAVSRLHTKDDFLKHIASCEGVKEMVIQEEEKRVLRLAQGP